MPELPEVESLATGVDRSARGALITDFVAIRPDVLREASVGEFRERTRGEHIVRARRRAKHIVIEVESGDALVIQPRFTGGLLVERLDAVPDDERRYVAVYWALADGRVLAYRDVRRLGTVALMSPERAEEYFGSLGAEPLDQAFTAEQLSGILRASRQPVKKVIMDQYRIVGVGNIYANEALWRAGIDPSRAASRITAGEAALLRDEIVAVLTEAIQLGGSTIRDYRGVAGEPGTFVERHAAYGRGGQPCRRCGARLIETHEIDGRQTVLCARCQH